MKLEQDNISDIGKYRGVIDASYSDLLSDYLPKIKELISADDVEVLATGRNINVRTAISVPGGTIDLVVKSFGRESALKNLIDHSRGSKAHRTWLVARHLQQNGVGTPDPVAFMERWQGQTLIENYFVSVYQADISSFTNELARLFNEEPECWKFMNLLKTVAEAIADMHRCGCQHNDLGNQNIMLARNGNGQWNNVQFIDLNRADITDSLSVKQRARDISRIWLPSDLLRVFIEMYFGGKVPSEDFIKWERIYRKRYAKHAASRKLRHPINTLKNLKTPQPPAVYPVPRDLWIWDERSAQPIVTIKSKDRHRLYSSSWIRNPVLAVLSKFMPVKKEYIKLKSQCYRDTIDMSNRFGISIEPRATIWNEQKKLLHELGNIPVSLRFYHHESAEMCDFKIKIVGELFDLGFSVSATLVQDRRAVNDSVAWKIFVEKILDNCAKFLEYLEVGHAVNRVKWGIWSFAELNQLVSIVIDVASQWPELKLTGPAAIDFEYPFVMAALRNAPKNTHFSALSHHLYVDRRGAPENKQGKFDSLDKFAMARAIARNYECCNDKLIISEVNWPLLGTGVYSPVGAPYESPGTRYNDPSVSEEDYANFMIRYVAIATSSGMVERVYWWRLVAHGFGLIDDINISKLRKRAAFTALKTYIQILGDSLFLERITLEQLDKVYIFKYRTPDKREIYLAWTNNDAEEVKLPFTYSTIRTLSGITIEETSNTITLTGAPVYLSL